MIEQTPIILPRTRDKSPADIGRQSSQIINGSALTPTPNNAGLDSGEQRVMIGKPPEEIKLIKMMRQKLQTTSIPQIEFEDASGHITHFEDYYDYLKPLGCGSFGFVVSAIDKISGEHVALKIVDTSNESSVRCIKKEAEILETLGHHSHVIQYRHIREFVNYIVLAIENARGGTLADLIKRRCGNNTNNGSFIAAAISGGDGESFQAMLKQPELTDEECAKVIKGILLGVKHIHSQDFVHRDLKPSNVVIDNIQDLETVKIVDFGLAIKVSLKHGLEETCGTLVYQAPEQMFGETSYGKPIDLWAVGFIMYELIAGQHPTWTRGEDKPAYREKMKNFKGLTFEHKKFTPLSISLIEKLTIYKPSARYKVDQALQHPWITRNFEDKIPRTLFEESIFQVEIDNKLRKCCHLILFLSITKDFKRFNEEREERRRLLQQQIDEEERIKREMEAIAEKEAELKKIQEELEAENKKKKKEAEKNEESKRKDQHLKEQEGSLLPQVTPDFAQLKAAIPKIDGIHHQNLFQHLDDEHQKLDLDLPEKKNDSEIDQFLEIPPDTEKHCQKGSQQQLESQKAIEFKKRYSMIRQSSEIHNINHEYARSRQYGEKRESSMKVPKTLGADSSKNDITGSIAESDRSQSSSSFTAHNLSHNANQTRTGIEKQHSGKPPLANQAIQRDHSANAIRSGDGSQIGPNQRTQKTFRIHKVGQKRAQQTNQAIQQQQSTTNSEMQKPGSGLKLSPMKKRGDKSGDLIELASRNDSGDRSMNGQDQSRASGSNLKNASKKLRRNSSNHSKNQQQSSSSDDVKILDALSKQEEKKMNSEISQNQGEDEICIQPPELIEMTMQSAIPQKSKKSLIQTSSGVQHFVRKRHKQKNQATKRQKSQQPQAPIAHSAQPSQQINISNYKPMSQAGIISPGDESGNQLIPPNPCQTAPPSHQPSSQNLNAAGINIQKQQVEVRVQHKLQSANKNKDNKERDLSQTMPKVNEAPTSIGNEKLNPAQQPNQQHITPQKGQMHPSTPGQTHNQMFGSKKNFNPIGTARQNPAPIVAQVQGVQHHPGRKLVSASDQFDIIKHGSGLKDHNKSPHQQQSPNLIGLQNEYISPIKKIIAQESEAGVFTSYKKQLQNHLLPCNEDPNEDRDDRGLKLSAQKRGQIGLGATNMAPSNQPILSPFEQFLHNLMMQSEIDKQSQKVQHQQPIGLSEKINRQRQVEGFIRKNAMNPQTQQPQSNYNSLIQPAIIQNSQSAAPTQIQNTAIVVTSTNQTRENSQSHHHVASQQCLQLLSRQRASQTMIHNDGAASQGNQQHQFESLTQTTIPIAPMQVFSVSDTPPSQINSTFQQQSHLSLIQHSNTAAISTTGGGYLSQAQLDAVDVQRVFRNSTSNQPSHHTSKTSLHQSMNTKQYKNNTSQQHQK